VKGKNSIIYIKKRLDEEAKKRNNVDEVSVDKLDPILVAHRHKDPTISLIWIFPYSKEVTMR
jgi:predicted metal-dependent RNase